MPGRVTRKVEIGPKERMGNQPCACGIRARLEELEDFETFRGFVESTSYVGATRRRFPIPVASTVSVPDYPLGFSHKKSHLQTRSRRVCRDTKLHSACPAPL